MSAAARAVLALGANLGDRLEALRGAVRSLGAADGIEVVAVSAVYETEPVGGPEQPGYLNAVILVRTTLEPAALLRAAQAVEQEWHRTREVRWGPRTLDIDIIDFDDRRSDDPDLTLPHPRAGERAFVLVPWLEVEPADVLPGIGPIAAITVDTAGVRRTDHDLAVR